MLVAESDLLSYPCRVAGARNVEGNCRLGLRSVLRHCALGAGRLRPLVGHALGISASFFRRRSNPHPRRYIDHRRSARTCGFICPFCAGGGIPGRSRLEANLGVELMTIRLSAGFAVSVALLFVTPTPGAAEPKQGAL